jgi:hypothetical protein
MMNPPFINNRFWTHNDHALFIQNSGFGKRLSIIHRGLADFLLSTKNIRGGCTDRIDPIYSSITGAGINTNNIDIHLPGYLQLDIEINPHHERNNLFFLFSGRSL